MIPFFRSHAELMVITQAREQLNNNCKINNNNIYTEDSGQRKRYIRSKDKQVIDLPDLPKKNRQKWERGKETVLKFFDALDYNNQNQPSYEITLLERQNNYNINEVA